MSSVSSLWRPIKPISCLDRLIGSEESDLAGGSPRISLPNAHLVPLPHARYLLAYQRFGIKVRGSKSPKPQTG